MKNIIICGAPRAGTTSLFRYLSAHPDIAPSPTKELNFFIGGRKASEDVWNNNMSSKEYNAFFLDGNLKLSVEASPAYMHPCYADKVASRIHGLLPDAKLVIMLREPVERLCSDFDGRKERSSQLVEGFSFADYVEAIMNNDNLEGFGIDREDARLASEGVTLGVYAATIKEYLNFFSAENIKIVFTENLAQNPAEVMLDTCEWLSISPSLYKDYQFNVENKMVNAKYKTLYIIALYINRWLEPLLNHAPNLRHAFRNLHHLMNAKPQLRKINDETHELLDAFYLEHNQELLSLLNDNWQNISIPVWLSKTR